jgi:hypothetical protein
VIAAPIKQEREAPFASRTCGPQGKTEILAPAQIRRSETNGNTRSSGQGASVLDCHRRKISRSDLESSLSKCHCVRARSASQFKRATGGDVFFL